MKRTMLIGLLSILFSGFFYNFSPLNGKESTVIDPVKLYQKKKTWFDTMLAFQKALHEKKDSATVLQSPLPLLHESDFTITAWLKTKEGGTILAKTSAEGNWELGGKTFFVRGGRLCFDIGWVGCLTSRRKVADGKWHHVAVTRHRDNLQFFIDGKEDNTTSMRFTPDKKNYVLKIGYTNRNFPVPTIFKGSLDEIHFYAKKLSPREIKKDFTEHPAQKDPELMGCWSFDGNTTDSSGCGNNASRTVQTNFTTGKFGKALILKGRIHLVVYQPGDSRWGIPWDLFEKDFTDPVSKREIAFETEDNIWRFNWQYGDWKTLANRYLNSVKDIPEYIEQVREKATKARGKKDIQSIRKIYFKAKALAGFKKNLKAFNLTGLQKAIMELMKLDPEMKVYLDKFNTIQKQLYAMKDNPEKLSSNKLIPELKKLRREVLIDKNPLIDFDKLVFIKRYTYQSSHYYTDYIDGCVSYGGNVYILSLSDGKTRKLVPELDGGIFGRFDISFDAKKILFDYKAAPKEGFRIYEIGVDGKGLRQLTFPPSDEQARIKKYAHPNDTPGPGPYYHQTDDMHPCYLPDGRICFTSTRCERGILCDGPDILTTTALYRINPDGSDMTLLSQTPVSEEVPSVMNDGRILYTRWEYIDKGGSAVKCLWAMHPDGSGSVEIFGNDHAYPSFYNGRAVPDHSNMIAVIGGPHMPYGVGTVIRLDLNEPITEKTPMTYITPKIDIKSEWGYRNLVKGKWVATQKGPLFDDPFPLSDKFFLVTFNPDKDVHDKSAYGLYLLDEFGHRELIYRDPEISCFQPMPLKPRKKPPIIPKEISEKDKTGSKPEDGFSTVVLTDVYQGLEGIPRGTVKYIRVMEDIPRPWSARRFWRGDQQGQQHCVISKWTHTHAKTVYGIVPVEKDGSAYFKVPSDRNIFFQALDKDFMEIQRMRTFVNFMPGEHRSCIGCHEPLNMAPPTHYPLAMRHKVVDPAPQPGDKGPRPIYYSVDVQPILDKHCIKCHGGEKPAGDLALTGELTTLFNRSYENIIDKKLVKAVSEIRSKMGNVPVTGPYVWGSHASKLIDVLLKGHYKAKLSREEFIRLVTWVDANAPYYGSYYGRRNLRYKNHKNFRPILNYQQVVSLKAPLPDDER